MFPCSPRRSTHTAWVVRMAPTPRPRLWPAPWRPVSTASQTDVCLTSDGKLVLLHDPLLSLGTTLDGWAHEHTATAIVQARILDRDRVPTDERPLTLDELLAYAPADLPIQVEVKAHADPELARRTAVAVCERNRRGTERGRLELISFHSAACATAAAYGFRSRLVGLGRLRARGARGMGRLAWGDGGLGRALSALREAGLGLPPRRAERQHRHRQRCQVARPNHRARGAGRGLHDRPAELRAEVLRIEEASSTTAIVDAELATAGLGARVARSLLRHDPTTYARWASIGARAGPASNLGKRRCHLDRPGDAFERKCTAEGNPSEADCRRARGG